MGVKFIAHLDCSFLAIWIPRYVTEFFTGIPWIEATKQALTGKSSHLFRLRESPEALEKDWIVSTATDTWDASLRNRAVSSASWLMSISLLAMTKPFNGLSLMCELRSCTERRNKYTDRGHPCLTPRFRENLGEVPLASLRDCSFFI